MYFCQVDKVIGADINKEKVELINKGISPLKNEELVPELLEKYVREGKIRATTDLNYAAKNSEVKIIIVPPIIDEQKNDELDFSIINSVTEEIAKNLNEGDLIIISTTMPLGG